MTIAPEILKHYPDLNEAQRRVIAHQEGPLLVIAGPGSGKTYSIVLRALNLLLLGKAEPRQMVMCTFTEKAAFELRDRIAAAARRVGFESDLSELHVTTIHGLCNRFIAKHRHHSPLGNNYETLDELTQLLFIFEHFDQIVGTPENERYLHRWKTKWTAIEGARNYFDKITEELVDVGQMSRSTDPFLGSIADAYLTYETALYQNNRTDFAHMQRIAYDLLADETLRDDLTKDIRYVLVDEYQDTNTVQEQLLLKLTEHSGNLCVVDDEDQSLYRFRQTIEDIHRTAMDGRLDTLDHPQIRSFFERNFRFLCLSDVRPIGDAAKERAFTQVMHYFRQNQAEMHRVIQTEVDVSLEKDGYILVGKVDLLMGNDGKLELLDFKTSERSTDPALLSTYEDQLCTYAHVLERRHGKHPERLLLYWTAEQEKSDALMEIPYRPEQVEAAGRRFDQVVSRIQARDFSVTRKPERRVCKECDLKALCGAEGYDFGL